MQADDRSTTSTWKGDVAFAAAVTALFAVLVLRVFPALLDGFLVDTDSYMRLVRVRQLAETGGWFDGGMIERSNAPFGSSLHWTRPVDLLILLGAWVATPFLGFEQALHVAGVALSPVLLVLVCFATAWAAKPLAGPDVRYYAMIAVLAQVALVGYALPGRADHHILILLAFVSMYGSVLRVVLAPEIRSAAWAAGAWAAFGLWISTEFLVPVFLLLSVIGAMWVVEGRKEVARRGVDVAVGLLAISVVAVLLEHSPASWLATEFDRISVVHVLVAAVAVGFWLGAAFLSPDTPVRRTVYAVLGTAAAVAIVYGAYPRFFGGPMVDVDPELQRTWLPLLTEYQPYLVPRGIADLGRIIAYLGHALIACIVVGYVLVKRRWSRSSWAWILLGAGLAVFITLGVRWVRFAPYAELLGVIGTMVLLAAALRRIEGAGEGLSQSIRRVLVTSGLLAGPILVGAVVMAAGGEVGETVQEAGATQVDQCSIGALLAGLNDPDGLGDRPRTVLAHVDLGPILLYRTPHSVLATPYHRNAAGILDARRIMTSAPIDEARGLLAERGVEVIVPCGFASGPMGNESTSLVAVLRGDVLPSWLVRRPLPGTEGRQAVYEVITP